MRPIKCAYNGMHKKSGERYEYLWVAAISVVPFTVRFSVRGAFATRWIGLCFVRVFYAYMQLNVPIFLQTQKNTNANNSW